MHRSPCLLIRFKSNVPSGRTGDPKKREDSPKESAGSVSAIFTWKSTRMDWSQREMSSEGDGY